MSYEITCSITALCPCCGKALPSSAYLTESRAGTSAFERDNPYERKDRRVFVAPCEDCFKPARVTADLLEALQKLAAAYKRLKPLGYPQADAEKQADAAITKALGEQA